MNNNKIIDGKAFSRDLQARIGREAQVFREKTGHTPSLAVILVGDDAASRIYVREKAKAALEAGINSLKFEFPHDVSQSVVLDKIRELNNDPDVQGILVQLPLPAHINELDVVQAVDPLKDVDGFHTANVGALALGGEGMAPCTPLGCVMLLKRTLGDLTGKRVVIIGSSNIVGKPLAQLLLRENCTVMLTHIETVDLAGECRRADILVSAAGQPEMVRADWVKPGAVVIDVGINRVQENGCGARIVGDIHFDGVADVASAITPVPGGVGPMTIACLLRNTLIAACRQSGMDAPNV